MDAEAEKNLFQQEIFADMMDKFDAGLLTYTGKGGIQQKVTNSKQAYAMAMGISERQWKRYKAQQDTQKIDNFFKKTI